MECDQQDTLVICISPGLKGKWDVSEKGFDEPIASFDEKEDAYAYASDLTRAKPRATVLVEDEDGFSPLPLHEYRSGLERARPHGGGTL